jgi:hypothetical protein
MGELRGYDPSRFIISEGCDSPTRSEASEFLTRDSLLEFPWREAANICAHDAEAMQAGQPDVELSGVEARIAEDRLPVRQPHPRPSLWGERNCGRSWGARFAERIRHGLRYGYDHHGSEDIYVDAFLQILEERGAILRTISAALPRVI